MHIQLLHLHPAFCTDSWVVCSWRFMQHQECSDNLGDLMGDLLQTELPSYCICPTQNKPKLLGICVLMQHMSLSIFVVKFFSKIIFNPFKVAWILSDLKSESFCSQKSSAMYTEVLCHWPQQFEQLWISFYQYKTHTDQNFCLGTCPIKKPCRPKLLFRHFHSSSPRTT